MGLGKGSGNGKSRAAAGGGKGKGNGKFDGKGVGKGRGTKRSAKQIWASRRSGNGGGSSRSSNGTASGEARQLVKLWRQEMRARSHVHTCLFPPVAYSQPSHLITQLHHAVGWAWHPAVAHQEVE
jgi:hypothetical protein